MYERKKLRKQRGHRTHGWGSKKKHRGKGSQGGKGYGGSSKHKRSYIYAYEPEHFGYKGFTPVGGKKKIKIINVGSLERISNGQKEINLNVLGYDKLLSQGNINTSLTVHVKKYSAKAKDKIEKKGGKIVSE